MKISGGGNALAKSGNQTLTDGILSFSNTKGIGLLETGGTSRTLVSMDSSNNSEIGATTNVLQLLASGNPTVTYGSATHKNVDDNSVYIVKQDADQSVDNSTTLVASTGLVMPVEASSHYLMIGSIYIASGVSPDSKFALSLPSGGSGFATGVLINASNSARYAPVDCTSEQDLFFVGTLSLCWSITTSSSGSVVFKWAQNTQVDGTASVLKAASSIIVCKLL